MHVQISESDWKRFRKLSQLALERFCSRVLSEVGQLAADTATDPHQRYLSLYKLVEARDSELGDLFNDCRRSTAFPQLARIRSFGLLTDEEFAEFSETTRGAVAVFSELFESGS